MQVALPLLVQILNELPLGEYLVIAYNKMGLCRQVVTIASHGRLQVVCDDDCNEGVAADHARRIVDHSIHAALRKIDSCSMAERAWVLPFHASATTPEAGRCCGRRAWRAAAPTPGRRRRWLVPLLATVPSRRSPAEA